MDAEQTHIWKKKGILVLHSGIFQYSGEIIIFYKAALIWRVTLYLTSTPKRNLTHLSIPQFSVEMDMRPTSKTVRMFDTLFRIKLNTSKVLTTPDKRDSMTTHFTLYSICVIL